MSDVAVNLEHSNDLKQMQRLMLSAKMQQALHLLQAPIMELSILIEAYLEQNPLLSLADENDEEQKDFGEECEELDSTQIDEEQALNFHDDEFSILRQLEDDFADHLTDIPSETNSESERFHTYLEQSIPSLPTLFEHLMHQAQEVFENPDELSMAEKLIGELTPEGYLHTSLKEISKKNKFAIKALQHILEAIQTFEPNGVGASSVQECFLIQLRNKGKEHSLAYAIIESHYDDLLHNRIPAIQNGLKCSANEIENALKREICHLDLHPGLFYSKDVIQTIIPDVLIQIENQQCHVFVNEEYMPTLRLNGKYMRLIDEKTTSQDTKEFIRKQFASAKWLMRNIHQRNETLTRIVQALYKIQREFFEEPNGKLVPLTMKKIAEELQIHESTVARAIANKYLDCARGVLPLKMFFSNAYDGHNGKEISSETVRALLLQIVKEENKEHPLSDEQLSSCLMKHGVKCARRTIAKYRSELNIGSAQQRRRFV